MDENNINSGVDKRPSCLNATKHGLTAASLPKIEGFDYDGYFEAIEEDFKPIGMAEKIIIDRMAINNLRAIKAGEIESDLFSNANHKEIDGSIKHGWRDSYDEKGEELTVYGKLNFENELDLIDRYLVNAENRFYKALSELREIRKNK